MTTANFYEALHNQAAQLLGTVSYNSAKYPPEASAAVAQAFKAMEQSTKPPGNMFEDWVNAVAPVLERVDPKMLEAACLILQTWDTSLAADNLN